MDQNLAEKPSLKSPAPRATKVKSPRTRQRPPIQIPPLTPSTLVNLFFVQAASRPEATQFAAKHDGVWQKWTWRKVAENASALAVALTKFQVEIGDRVALVSENRPEWGIADLAILMVRGITVPVYITNTAADHEYIFGHSGAKLVIVSNAHLAERVIEAAGKTSIRHIISFEHLPQKLRQQAESLKIAVHVLDDLVAAAPDAYATLSSDPNSRWRGANAQELCRLAYTSGTGGQPRGVMLSHDNIMANLEGCIERFQKVLLQPNRALPNQFVPPGQSVPERFLSFLPLSHSYEHTVGLYLAMALAAEVYYCETADRLMQYLQETQPTLVTLVPRIYELLFHRIEATLKFGPAWRRWLFGATRKYGIMVYDRKKHLGRVANPLLTLLVRRKMRARFGGRIKALVSGGAALPVDMARYFNGLGLPVCQGYGQTETAPVVSFNPPTEPRLHTVGLLLPGVECRIADDGEICLRGRMVMRGYWQDQASTDAALQNGWLHTGDVGYLDQGYLVITDRKRDIIKLSGGDTLSPARIEGIITLSPEINQALVMGDGQSALAAVLVPSADFIADYAATHRLPADLAILCQNADFHRVLGQVLECACQGLANIERVRRFVIASEPFTVQKQYADTLV